MAHNPGQRDLTVAVPDQARRGPAKRIHQTAKPPYWCLRVCDIEAALFAKVKGYLV